MDIKIFVSHRIDQQSVKIDDNPLFYNIRCGAVYDNKASDLPGDHIGDNISFKRMSYCELTIHYWVWKNVKADYYGFCHYRRYLSFAEREYPENEVGVVVYPEIDDTAIQRFKLNEVWMRQEIEQYDIITNTPIPVRKSGDFSSVLDYCKKNPQGYRLKDIEILREVVAEKYPDDLDDFDAFFAGRENRWYNCYIIRAPLFHEYAAWLFDILFEFENRIDTSNYTQEQLRVFGVMAERLWGVFLRRIERQGLYSIKERQLVYFEDTKVPAPLPQPRGNSIPIFIPAIKFTIPLVYATIKSIAKHIDNGRHCDITCLHDGLDASELKALESLQQQYDGMTVSSYDVSKYVKRYRKLIFADMPVSDFIAFSIFDVCKQYERILFVNPNVIFKHDVAQLFDSEINEAYAAAPCNTLTLIQCYQNQYVQEFFRRSMGQQGVPWRYYNFDIGVLNMTKILGRYSVESFIKMAELHNYGSAFCDIMNAKLGLNIQPLPLEWGVTADKANFLHDHGRWYLPYADYNAYLDVYRAPKAIYFSWFSTPWSSPDMDYAEEFWGLLRGTEFYERTLDFLISQRGREALQMGGNGQSLQDPRSGARKLADKFLPMHSRRRNFVKSLIPRDSLRWKLCKQVYYILRPRYRPVNQDVAVD